MATVTGSTPYTVTSSATTVTGSAPYTVVAKSYPVQKRVGSTLKPVQIGKRRGSTIDWLTPDIS